ncbi:hypothetical protein LIER_42911 [Lithospermum erythrorhizon]|uniref:Retroviral polymerase SH3-like domain-containing protein n=1 Tax=Lithospermum erythrorhizon TaxID=34254 RepID=A0AAV3P4S8_LITER
MLVCLEVSGEKPCVAIHVINLSPTAVLEGKVPEEVWSGKERSCKHLRVFGCKLYDPIAKKVIRSRDVVFAEDQNINDINKSVEDKVNDDLIDFDSQDEDEDKDQPAHEINLLEINEN